MHRTSTMADLAAELAAVAPGRVSTAAAVREHHSHGESYHPPHPPDIVVFPETSDEVVTIVRACAAHGVPMVPFGSGTSLEAHVAAVRGGVSIDMTRMNRIVRVSVEDLDATVEAGVTHKQLNKHVNGRGVSFFVNPGADCTIGGMAATRASGTTAVRYGTMRENVLALSVVLADGRLIRTGTRARKSSAGYDLTRLFVGSEGTLGVITEVTVRLHGLPDAVAAATCAFESIEGAVDVVIATIQLGIPVARIELLDEVQMDAINRYSGLSCPVAPTLFFEFHGRHPPISTSRSRRSRELATENSGSDFQWAHRPEESIEALGGRHNAHVRVARASAGRPGLDHRRLRADF